MKALNGRLNFLTYPRGIPGEDVLSQLPDLNCTCLVFSGLLMHTFFLLHCLYGHFCMCTEQQSTLCLAAPGNHLCPDHLRAACVIFLQHMLFRTKAKGS